MLPNNTTRPAYHFDGPVLPGETVHEAMGLNTTYSLGGHLLNRPAQGISQGPLRPGGSIEHEPVDAAERAAQHAAKAVFSITDTARSIRSALRPGV